MIEGLSEYAYVIISIIFFIIVIQMILPDGNNKKYIFFVSSMVLTIAIINPAIKLLNKEINIDNIFEENKAKYVELENQEYEKYYKEKLVSTYKENIEKDIIKRLEESGYTVHSIDCEYDKETLEPEFIILEIEANNNGVVQPVKIEVNNNLNSVGKKITSFEELELKNMLVRTYGFDEVILNPDDE